MRESIASWDYYADFAKVYSHIQPFKVELNILNALVGSRNPREEFIDILNNYPRVLRVVPLLLAKRGSEITITETKFYRVFNFNKMDATPEEYADFMENTGLFDLLSNHLINNVIDYVTGVEVGMDTNGRKNRTGHNMEDLVEGYIFSAGFVPNKTYFKEMTIREIEEKFHISLGAISNEGKTEKRFDFVLVDPRGEVYGMECNFYSSGGSKLNETARSYKNIALESCSISHFHFIWITDGVGWNTARHNLEETFDVLPLLFNIHDLDSGVLEELNNPVRPSNLLKIEE